ncbi:MAG TPA: hydroxysqualene dehydroxylase HpnE [Accumulibacter sp.]|nr:hydroxysqualene dehydroxylase HpnE [Accumulibacter sp.]HMY07715.1 hydroxysqualene dehydroxylase HpnE [Accumulibacter sp.]HNG38221.1 hydroxysqualene dehydroxylase HpnE [Accumulibacter sp.]HNO58323.1 hydroxysqualene dehydroxylase HpnE [Accumulibacter sp.]
MAHLGARMKVAVIGGGWAGLAAAVELAAAGVQVCVFEAAGQLGGRARRVTVHGQALDNGQHLLLGAYHETLRLLRRVGAEPTQLFKRLPLDIVFLHGGETAFRLRLPRLPAPWHLVAGLLTADGVHWRDILAAVRLMRRLRRGGYRTSADDTVTALLDRQEQSGILRHFLWEPLCLAAMNTAPDEASAQIFLNTLRDSLGSGRAATDLLLPAVDLDRLWPAAAAQFIVAHGGSVRLNSRIRSLDRLPEVADERFDATVLAVAPQHAGRLLQPHPLTADAAALLAGYAFEPIATVYCAYPSGVRLPSPMLGLAPFGGPRIGQWVFDRGALCGTAGMLAFVLSGRGAWQRLTDSVLATTLHRELEDALRQPLPAFAWMKVIREQRATYACRAGLPRLPVQTARAGLWLAGDYLCAEYPATLEAAMRSGVRVAAEILAANR